MPRNISKRSRPYREHPVFPYTLIIDITLGVEVKSQADARMGSDAYLILLEEHIQKMYPSSQVSVKYQASLNGMKVLVSGKSVDKVNKGEVESNIKYFATIILNEYRDIKSEVITEASIILTGFLKPYGSVRIRELKDKKYGEDYGINGFVVFPSYKINIDMVFFNANNPKNKSVGSLGCKVSGGVMEGENYIKEYERFTNFRDEYDMDPIIKITGEVLSDTKTEIDKKQIVASKLSIFLRTA